MPVDRAFTVAGAGTVVTGGIIAGEVRVGDIVVALPSGQEARVRSLHALGKAAEASSAGERAALNLAGLDRQAIARGAWLVTPAQRSATSRLDADVRLLSTEAKPLKTWTPVYLHAGTSAVEARLVLLEGDALAPGQRCLVQLVLQEPLPVRAGDRIVLRDAGGERTIGGGMVIDPTAPQRFRRAPGRLAQLSAMRERDAASALDGLLALAPGIVDFTGFAGGRGLADDEADELCELIEPAVGEADGRRFVALPVTVERLGQEVAASLSAFHAANPERPGMGETPLRLSLATRLTKAQLSALLAMLAPAGEVIAQGGLARLASHSSSLGEADQRLWERIEKLIGEGAERHRPPQVRELAPLVGQPIAAVRKLCKTMARLGLVTEVATDRFFLRSALLELGLLAQELAAENAAKTFSAAEFRDRAGSGRNVGIQILEHFDRRGLTLRQGDVRRVVKEPSAVFGPK